MTTSFTGTKILKYPVPRVTNPATGMGFEGSTGEFILYAGTTSNMGGEHSSTHGDVTTGYVEYKNPRLPTPEIYAYSIKPITIGGVSYPQMTLPLDATVSGLDYRSKYGPRHGVNGNFHYGIDIGVFGTTGVAIWAVWDGTAVIHQGWSDSAGWYMSVNHGMMNIEGKNRQVYTTYMHMADDPSPRISNGKVIKAGDFLGWVSGSGTDENGNGYSRHLHFELRLDKDLEYNGSGVKYVINPVPYLQTGLAPYLKGMKL
jgi:murein DD-endopeptidase MepM/ murein hydrolase activator NlpD